MTAAALAPPIEFPPGYSADAILCCLCHSAITEETWTEGGAEMRREKATGSPLHFNLIYLDDYVSDQTTGLTSFAEGHMRLYRGLWRWAEVEPSFWAVCAPRGYSKSTTISFGGVLWAMCCHPELHRFTAIFSHSLKQAWNYHVLRFKEMLDGRTLVSQKLLHDFPHMRILSASNGRLQLAGGGAIMAAGLLDGKVGAVNGADRPDLGVFDDMLPGKETTPTRSETVKEIITDVALPMFVGHADILITGTVFCREDLIDDVVSVAIGRVPRSADRGHWLTGRNARCTYIVPDWPQKWSTEFLDEQWQAGQKTYALRFEPHLLDEAVEEQYFTDKLFADHRVIEYHPIRRVIMTDHATSGRTGGKKNDKTAIAVLCTTSVAGRVIVEHVEAGNMDVSQLHARCKWLHERAIASDGLAPDTWGWERNGGHELGVDSMRTIGALPLGVELLPFDVHGNKAQRIEALHGRYKANAIYHYGEFPEYERQAIGWVPNASGAGVDDMLDAVAAGVRLLLTGHAGDKTT